MRLRNLVAGQFRQHGGAADGRGPARRVGEHAGQRHRQEDARHDPRRGARVRPERQDQGDRVTGCVAPWVSSLHRTTQAGG